MSAAQRARESPFPARLFLVETMVLSRTFPLFGITRLIV
jgi:hypothetical protein